MIPNLTIGANTISAYMLCTMIGVLVAGAVTIHNAKGKDTLVLTTVLLWAAPGVVVGSHVLYAITNLSELVLAIQQGCGIRRIIAFFGGSVFYGGLIGGWISARLYCRFAHIDPAEYADDAAVFIPLFHCFGRIGCFLSGCCYGIECPIGFIYRYSLIESANFVPRFPIQLVEAVGNLLLFFMLYKAYNHARCVGNLLAVYGVSYSVLRFTTEFFRGDAYRGFLFSLSTSQLISIGIGCVSAMVLLYRRRAQVMGNG